VETIRSEYEEAVRKRAEISGELRNLEKEEPDNLRAVWIARDRLAFWEGKVEGLKFALDELERKA
jgi:hypothetical protein